MGIRFQGGVFFDTGFWASCNLVIWTQEFGFSGFQIDSGVGPRKRSWSLVFGVSVFDVVCNLWFCEVFYQRFVWLRFIAFAVGFLLMLDVWVSVV